MGTFLLFILKSGICLTLFYVVFRFLMSRTTFFRLNRFTLLDGLLLCMCLPFIQLEIKSKQPIQSSMQAVQDFLLMEPQLQDVPVNFTGIEEGYVPVHTTVESNSTVSPAVYVKWGMIAIYVSGLILVILHLSVSTYRMLQLIYQSQKIKYNGYILAISDQSISSFSWGKYIVISRKDYESHSEEILLHELMHLRYRHTWDLFLMQIFLVLHWFNPVIWLLKRELQEIHEYEADNGVINAGIDATKYQLLLVKKTVGTRLYSMANGFNHSKLKNRIVMMLKERNKSYVRIRLFLFVPLLMGVLYIFAQPGVESEISKLLPENMITADGGQPLEKVIKLKDGFKRDFATYETAKSLKKSGRSDRKFDLKNLNPKELHLFVNAKDELLLDAEKITTESLKKRVFERVVEKREQSRKANGNREAVVINVLYDRGTSIQQVERVFDSLEKVIEDVRSKELYAENGQDRTLDNVFPMLVHIVEGPFHIFNDKDYLIKDIQITLLWENPTSQTKKLTNFTLSELKTEINRLFDQGVRTDKFVLSLELLNKEGDMGQVDNVRATIQETFRERNMACPFS